MSKSITKQKRSAAKSVAVFFTVFIIIEMLIVAGVAAVFRNDDVTPHIFGYSFFIMDSAKIESVPEGSLVKAKEYKPTKDDIGKAVLCENIPGIGSSVFYLDDVVAKAETVDGVIYKVSQGISDQKSYDVSSGDIIGVAGNYYETAGKIISFVSTPIGIVSCAVVPLFLLAFIELIIALLAQTKKDEVVYEDDQEYYDDNDEELTIEDVLYDQYSNRDSGDREEYDQTEDDSDSDSELNFNSEDECYSETEYIDDADYTDEQGDEPSEEIIEEEVVVEQKPHVDAEESISTTKKTASDSLEELMKMMEDEQKKLREDLKNL